MKHIKLFVFDMDGLIFDTERLTRIAWEKACKEHDFIIENEVLHNLVGRKASDGVAILKSVLGPGAPLDKLFEAAERNYMQIITKEPIPVKPGIREMLQYLRAHKLPAIVGTGSSTDRAKLKLSSAGLLDYFYDVIGSDQVARGKPAPDTFLKAADRFAAHPSDCIVFEDSAPGIQAAHAAKMTPVLIPDLRRPDPETCALAHYEFTSMEKCMEALIAARSKEK